MPLYTAPTTGNVRTALYPGDSLVLFDGTETPTAGLASRAFSPGPSPTGGHNALVFTSSFASSPTAAVKIQASNVDAEAEYQDLDTSTNTQHDSYADAGGFKFYRAVLSAYSAGGMPTVIVKA